MGGFTVVGGDAISNPISRGTLPPAVPLTDSRAEIDNRVMAHAIEPDIAPASGTDPYASYTAWKDWSAPFTYTRADAAEFAAELGAVRGLRVLELGFGEGRLLAWLHGQGATAVGVEIIGPLLDAGRRAGFQVHAPGDLPSQEFDRIIAFDVLEHMPLPELRKALRLIQDRLAPGGVAVCRFPNGMSPFGRVNQHGDMTHELTLTPTKLAQIIQAEGLDLELREIRNPRFITNGRNPLDSFARHVRHRLKRTLEWLIARIWSLPPQLDVNIVVVLAHTSTTTVSPRT